jgi:branched-subunit amino acid transport protein
VSWTDFIIILAITAGCTLACRMLPILLLNGRELPAQVTRALNYIPPAAFAALVVNDLVNPANFSLGLWPNLLPLVSLIPVAIVGAKTKSLWLCIVVGVIAYAVIKFFTIGF